MRHVTRDAALSAIRLAARAHGVDAAELNVSRYRTFRAQSDHGAVLPSEVAISLLFGGWHRAVEHAMQPDRPR